MKATRRQRSDALEPWRRQVRIDRQRAEWVRRRVAAGLCPRCSNPDPLPARLPFCDACRERHNARQARDYRRRQRGLRQQGLPTPKQLPALQVLASRPAAVWTCRTFALARWRQDQHAVIAVAGKVLQNLAKRGLAEQIGPGLQFRVSVRGRQVVEDLGRVN